MNAWTVTLIALIAGVVLVGGGAIVLYMGSLVKSAYQIKLEVRSDLEAGLGRLEEDADKKARWVKRDLVEEIEKARANLQGELHQRLDSLTARLTAAEAALAAERAEKDAAIEALRRDLGDLSRRFSRTGTAEPVPAAPPPVVAAAEPPAVPTPADDSADNSADDSTVAQN